MEQAGIEKNQLGEKTEPAGNLRYKKLLLNFYEASIFGLNSRLSIIKGEKSDEMEDNKKMQYKEGKIIKDKLRHEID